VDWIVEITVDMDRLRDFEFFKCYLYLYHRFSFFLNFVDIIETVDSTTVQEGKMILRNAAQYQQRWRHQY